MCYSLRYMIVALIYLGLVGCSALQTSSSTHTAREHWKNTLPAILATDNLPDKQSLLVLYRLNDIKSGKVNIYINQDYQTSLLENAMSQVLVCARPDTVISLFNRDGKLANSKQILNLEAEKGRVYYFKVSNINNTQIYLSRVTEATALSELQNLPKQSQTLSRVNRKQCLPVTNQPNSKGLVSADQHNKQLLQPTNAVGISNSNQYLISKTIAYSLNRISKLLDGSNTELKAQSYNALNHRVGFFIHGRTTI